MRMEQVEEMMGCKMIERMFNAKLSELIFSKTSGHLKSVSRKKCHEAAMPDSVNIFTHVIVLSHWRLVT